MKDGHGKPIFYVVLGYLLTQVSERFGVDLQPILDTILPAVGM